MFGKSRLLQSRLDVHCITARQPIGTVLQAPDRVQHCTRNHFSSDDELLTVAGWCLQRGNVPGKRSEPRRRAATVAALQEALQP
jgi:hypothetical protein